MGGCPASSRRSSRGLAIKPRLFFRRMSWEPDETPVYQNVARRRALAEKRAAELAEELSRDLSPATSKGKKIASTFWGQAWNRNLERYEEYEFSLPRGRSLLKNGQVLDLQIQRGQIAAWVSGELLCEVNVRIQELDPARWQSFKQRCAGQIQSVVALLQGQFPEGVMQTVTDQREGLFPEPDEIRFVCNCADYADMCEHAAAAAYAVSVRLDEEPALFFLLRGVDPAELLSDATQGLAGDIAQQAGSSGEAGFDDLSSLFGIDLDAGNDAPDKA